MARNQPTVVCDKLGNLDRAPVKTVGEYLTSKANQKCFLKPPTWDTPGDDIDSFFINAKYEHDRALKEQQLLVKSEEGQSAKYAYRIESIQRAHSELQKRFIKVNRFLREFDEKKKAAQRKVDIELEKQKDVTKNIVKLTEKFNILEFFRYELKITADQYEVYETVLEQAVRKSPDFGSAKECIDHCDAIMLAQNEIIDQNAIELQEIEKIKKRIIDITKQAQLILSGLKNELTEIQRSYTHTHAEILRWEKIYVEANQVVMSKIFDKERVRDGLNALYRLLCQRRSMAPEIWRWDVEAEADFIKDEVEIMQEILEKYNKRHNISETSKKSKAVYFCK